MQSDKQRLYLHTFCMHDNFCIVFCDPRVRIFTVDVTYSEPVSSFVII